jgi:hypothetical protein
MSTFSEDQAAPQIPGDSATPHEIDHDRLLYDFIHSDGSLFDLASAHGLSIIQLIEWYGSERTQLHLRALEEMNDTRNRLLAKSFAPDAMSALAEAASSPDSGPLEVRRAAAALLRHSLAAATARLEKESEAASTTGVPRAVSTDVIHIAARDGWRSICADDPRVHPTQPRTKGVTENGRHPPPGTPGAG